MNFNETWIKNLREIQLSYLPEINRVENKNYYFWNFINSKLDINFTAAYNNVLKIKKNGVYACRINRAWFFHLIVDDDKLMYVALRNNIRVVKIYNRSEYLYKLFFYSEALPEYRASVSEYLNLPDFAEISLSVIDFVYMSL